MKSVITFADRKYNKNPAKAQVGYRKTEIGQFVLGKFEVQYKLQIRVHSDKVI
jgi:hypothetical protein